ncbi:hypothetical protein VZH09_11910 [Synechococcus elongatus IITB7]|uniref:hypothetical protein n=1 Tax=Synechococcus elongatus TaxID=32046 RepID=UPI0030D56D63
MAPAKLSPADKQALIERFRKTTDPIAALAEQFGVSVSTVSRILRGSFPPKEYEQLRERRSKSAESPAEAPDAEAVAPAAVSLSEATPVGAADLTSEPDVETAAETAPTTESESTSAGRRRRRRSTAATAAETGASEETDNPQLADEVSTPSPESADSVTVTTAAEPAPTPTDLPTPTTDRPRPILKTAAVDTANPAAESTELPDEDELVETASTPAIDLELTADDLRGGGAAIEDADEFGEDDSEEDELAFDEEELGAEGESDRTEAPATLELLPLGIAPLPRTSYVVVDRTADLVTCSLTTLTELGTVEADHAEAQALPLFDNPRTAKRFCKRNQRVIKLPDSQILLKTTRWLQAKGIHCLLIDGQVYALDR